MATGKRIVPPPPKRPFWVFAYGSLMWDPGFQYTGRRAGHLFGYRRTLCILSYVYRGSPERPGLVFGLDAGGSCVGRVFRVEKSCCVQAYDYLMEREMVRGVYRPCWLPVVTPRGRITALCFVVDRRHEQYVPGLTDEQLVDRIHGARGCNGSNADYLLNTCHQLEQLGIRSPELVRLRAALAGLRRD